MPKKEAFHILPTKKGTWVVKRAGADRASVRTGTKSEAVKYGRVICQRSGGTLVVHGKDGKIQERM